MLLSAEEQAAQVLAKWEALDPATQDLQRIVGRWFGRQGRRFAQAFEPWAEALRFNQEAADDPPPIIPDGVIDQVNRQVHDEMVPELAPPLRQNVAIGYDLGIDNLITQIGVGAAFDLDNPAAVAYLEEAGALLVTRIQETTRKELRQLIVQATRERWAYNRLARAIKDQFDGFGGIKPQEHIRNRAELVAVTEIGNAYEQGTLDHAREMRGLGLTVQKRWLTVGDGRVTALCRSNQARGYIEIDDAFPSGHTRPLRFPGCRCTTTYRTR